MQIVVGRNERRVDALAAGASRQGVSAVASALEKGGGLAPKASIIAELGCREDVLGLEPLRAAAAVQGAEPASIEIGSTIAIARGACSGQVWTSDSGRNETEPMRASPMPRFRSPCRLPSRTGTRRASRKSRGDWRGEERLGDGRRGIGDGTFLQRSGQTL
ncbi:hypothetical protein [Thiocapsa bogorovii]|uniref:hypothetical protein n=1 Tax=Thiocapsa bogorovii TaxID=521689 RepID=UPI001E465972|nr:hypothetical protein [Thiocapsa bogorovii]UHD16686.1 hypothetical protein LT988_01070 [Thiocapsa bogorovii]